VEKFPSIISSLQAQRVLHGNMSFSLPSFVAKIPLPIFGSGTIAATSTYSAAKSLPRYAPWAVPAVAGALWFVWPAVGDETKIAWGILKDPAASKPAAAAPATSISVKDLDSSTKKAIEEAYLHHGSSTYSGPDPVPVDPITRAKRAQGDFTDLQKDWEAFHQDSLAYNEEDGTFLNGHDIQRVQHFHFSYLMPFLSSFLSIV
jgi:hypothetical protein